VQKPPSYIYIHFFLGSLPHPTPSVKDLILNLSNTDGHFLICSCNGHAILSNFSRCFTCLKRGVRGQVVKDVTIKPLASSPLWVRIPTGNVGGSTQVPVRAWNNAWKGIWSHPPPVKLERRQMTYTVSVWRQTQ
jgi:hypothetical protein